MSAVDPSEYVPVAVNCNLESIAKFWEVGVTVMEDNIDGCVGVDIGFDEQPIIAAVKKTANPIAKQ